MDYDRLLDAIDKRFPKAKFSVSCFKTIDEIENKILCDDNAILYTDEYTVSLQKKGKWVETEHYNDFFIVKKKRGQKHIYYKNVIDALIKQKFYRDDCNHRYLENIGKCYNMRIKTSMPVYGSFWGS